METFVDLLRRAAAGDAARGGNLCANKNGFPNVFDEELSIYPKET